MNINRLHFKIEIRTPIERFFGKWFKYIYLAIFFAFFGDRLNIFIFSRLAFWESPLSIIPIIYLLFLYPIDLFFLYKYFLFYLCIISFIFILLSLVIILSLYSSFVFLSFISWIFFIISIDIRMVFTLYPFLLLLSLEFSLLILWVRILTSFSFVISFIWIIIAFIGGKFFVYLKTLVNPSPLI